MIVYMYYGLLPEIKLSYLILSYLIIIDENYTFLNVFIKQDVIKIYSKTQ